MAERLIQVAAAIALAFFLVWAARADYIVEDKMNGEFVILKDTKCTNEKIMKQIPDSYKDQFFTGEAFVNKKRLAMCWAVNPDAYVVFMYEDGDGGMVPIGAFRKMSYI